MLCVLGSVQSSARDDEGPWALPLGPSEGAVGPVSGPGGHSGSESGAFQPVQSLLFSTTRHSGGPRGRGCSCEDGQKGSPCRYVILQACLGPVAGGLRRASPDIRKATVSQIYCWRAKPTALASTRVPHLSPPRAPCGLSGDGSLSKKLVIGLEGRGRGTLAGVPLACPGVLWALRGQHQSQWWEDPVQGQGATSSSSRETGQLAQSYLVRSPPALHPPGLTPLPATKLPCGASRGVCVRNTEGQLCPSEHCQDCLKDKRRREALLGVSPS